MSSHTAQEFEPGKLPLFERFVRLRESTPHVPLGIWPTPVMPAPRFAAAHGLASLHIKREDQSHPQFGGNKVRGLEFLIGDARSRDARSLITFSAAGSHHVCRTAYHASRFGLRTLAVFVDQPPGDYVCANLAAGLKLGVEYERANKLTLLPKIWKLRLRHASGNLSPCIYVPPGGTSPLACIGQVNAALELRRQIDAGMLPAPDYIYVAMGSLGTAAGLALGCHIAGISARIVGVVVSYRWYATRGRVRRIANQTLRLMRSLDSTVPYLPVQRSDVLSVRTALGRGYAIPTERAARLAEEMEQLEGLRLDPTYTAKAVDGMLQFIEAKKVHDKRHLYWHTYGEVPAVRLDPENVPAIVRKYFGGK